MSNTEPQWSPEDEYPPDEPDAPIVASGVDETGLAWRYRVNFERQTKGWKPETTVEINGRGDTDAQNHGLYRLDVLLKEVDAIADGERRRRDARDFS